jgi:hypothetical protein
MGLLLSTNAQVGEVGESELGGEGFVVEALGA